MERQEIPVRFADLRQFARTVPAYLTKQAGVEKAVDLRTEVEAAFGFIGLDTESLILEFGEQYRVELNSFDFAGFISSEAMNPKALALGCLLPIVLPAAWIVRIVMVLLCWPFSRRQALAIWKANLLQMLFLVRSQAISEVLTVGDFVASAAAGHFVKRERVRFVLV